MMRKHHIPNALTFARFIAVAVLIAVWYLPAPWGTWLPLVIVGLASITDFFDGYLARKWNVESDLGRLLDPNADKLLIATALILLIPLAGPVAVALILCRELFVSGLREYMESKNVTIHVTKLAKWKTTLQMVSVIVLLLAYATAHSMLIDIGKGLLWIATGLTVYTGWQYWNGVRLHLK